MVKEQLPRRHSHGGIQPGCHLAAWIYLLFSVGACWAQRLDSFEGGLPRWRFVESDCGAQLIEHEISPLMPRSGRTSELFTLACGDGQFALMAYPIEPCAVLNEFEPAVWFRCASARPQLGVRIVFPNALHPTQHERLTTILWGDAYSSPGQWQRLQITKLGDRLQQEVIALRNQFDSGINLDQAYIDALVINGYVGPGQTRMQIDDLDYGTIIPLASVGVELPSNWRQQWKWQDDQRALFQNSKQIPIWVDNRGEQPEWLRSLGFNGMILGQLPSPKQLDQAYEAGMSLISPPPEHLVEFDTKKLVAVKGWLIGTALNRNQTELARQQANLAEQLPQSMKRTLVGEALEQFWLYGRMAGQLIVPSPDPISAGDTASKRAWLRRTLETASQRGECWASVHVGTNPALADQYRAAIERIQGQTTGSIPANPITLRSEVIGAIMSGAKGIVYRTQSPILDPITGQASPVAQPNEDRVLQAAMRWTNSELKMWSPWILFGQPAPQPTLSRDDFAATSWRVRDAELIVAQNISPYSQLCMPGTRNRPLMISQPARQDPHEVLRLTEGRLELIRVDRSTGVQSWQVQQPNHIECFLVTGNPHVIGFVRQQMNRHVSEVATDQLEIANHNIEQATQVIEARFRSSRSESPVDLAGRLISVPPSATMQNSPLVQLMGLQRQLERGWQALQNGQPENASQIALQTIDQSQAVLHESFRVAISNLATPQASPLVLLPGTLQHHWRLAEACERSQWQAVELPGSSFSSLSQLLDAGWTQKRRLEDEVELRVELVPTLALKPTAVTGTQPTAGRSNADKLQPTAERLGPSLRMAAYPRKTTEVGPGLDALPGGFEGASLQVRSAGIPVRRGQLVRVSATALVRQCGSDPASGLLVYDNQAWTSLGQLVRGSPGQLIPVELYRFIVQDGQFQLLAECRGICDVHLQSVAISLIEPATDRHTFATEPFQPAP